MIEKHFYEQFENTKNGVSKKNKLNDGSKKTRPSSQKCDYPFLFHIKNYKLISYS